jgi:hypothetical protein
MGKSEKQSRAHTQVDASQADDVGLSPPQDSSGSTCEMGEGEEGEPEVSLRRAIQCFAEEWYG